MLSHQLVQAVHCVFGFVRWNEKVVMEEPRNRVHAHAACCQSRNDDSQEPYRFQG